MEESVSSRSHQHSSLMDAVSNTDRIIADAKKAYKEGNYREAIAMLTPLFSIPLKNLANLAVSEVLAVA